MQYHLFYTLSNVWIPSVEQSCGQILVKQIAVKYLQVYVLTYSSIQGQMKKISFILWDQVFIIKN